MALIKEGQVAQDTWRTLSDEDSIIGNGPVIISFERWRDAREALKRHNGPLGIRMKSDQPPSLIADDLERFDLIALEFPTLQDGRAFSYARLLRERHGFKGEIRAVGDVLREQAGFMVRCGVDAFEPADGSGPEQWEHVTQRFRHVYQRAADARTPAFAERGG